MAKDNEKERERELNIRKWTKLQTHPSSHEVNEKKYSFCIVQIVSLPSIGPNLNFKYFNIKWTSFEYDPNGHSVKWVQREKIGQIFR